MNALTSESVARLSICPERNGWCVYDAKVEPELTLPHIKPRMDPTSRFTSQFEPDS